MLLLEKKRGKKEQVFFSIPLYDLCISQSELSPFFSLIRCFPWHRYVITPTVCILSYSKVCLSHDRPSSLEVNVEFFFFIYILKLELLQISHKVVGLTESMASGAIVEAGDCHRYL